MNLFEECWNDDSWNKLCRQYLRNDVDALADCYIKWLDKSPSSNKETTERSNYMSTDIRRLIKNVKFNPPATIVFWTDNTKTVVKCNGEDYDPEKGLAMCICKKVLGNKGNYYKVFKKWLPKEDEAEQNHHLKSVLGAFDNPKTFTFELKPVSDKVGMFNALMGTGKEFQIGFKTEKDVEEKKEKRNCSTCKFFDEDSGCMSKIVCICKSVDEYSALEPKDE